MKMIVIILLMFLACQFGQSEIDGQFGTVIITRELGIKTNSPQTPFHVKGDSLMESNLTVRGSEFVRGYVAIGTNHFAATLTIAGLDVPSLCLWNLDTQKQWTFTESKDTATDGILKLSRGDLTGATNWFWMEPNTGNAHFVGDTSAANFVGDGQQVTNTPLALNASVTAAGVFTQAYSNKLVHIDEDGLLIFNNDPLLFTNRGFASMELTTNIASFSLNTSTQAFTGFDYIAVPGTWFTNAGSTGITNRYDGWYDIFFGASYDCSGAANTVGEIRTNGVNCKIIGFFRDYAAVGGHGNANSSGSVWLPAGTFIQVFAGADANETINVSHVDFKVRPAM